MKTTTIKFLPAILLILVGVVQPAPVPAATTVNATNCYAYSADLGWINGRGDAVHGAVIGEYVCSGNIYCANVGWISLGGGSPANGIQYQNHSAGDYGVNRDGLGNLRGYAYGANIGWVVFESVGSPKVDVATGKFSGQAYSANCGWIGLSNALAFVQTDTLARGADTDGDGIADAWELTWFGNLTTATATSDYDGDGMTDREEYHAGTSPTDRNENLRITSFTRVGTYNTLWWTSQPSHCYRVERRAALDAASPWETVISYELPGWNNVGFNHTGQQYFYRVRAVRPLLQ